MDKLTQFVTKSFEANNNSASAGDFKMKPDVKEEEEGKEEKQKQPPAKNWLIPDSPKSETYGIDLRLNNPNVIYTSSLILNQTRNFVLGDGNKPGSPKKWLDSLENKSPSPKTSYSSSSSPIDLEDSKSCPETLSEKARDEKDATENLNKDSPVDSDKKICKFSTS